MSGRAYKGTARYANSLAIRRSGYKGRAAAARSRVVGAARGYQRTGGYYGRFRGRRASGMGTELKFFDTVDTTNTFATAGSIANTSLNLIPQGVTESERLGRKCTLKRITVKGRCQLPATTSAAATSDRVKIMIIQDRQCNGATATVTGVLETAAYNSFRNLANTSRFRVLKQYETSLNSASGGAPTGTASFGEVVRNFSLDIRCNLPLEFDATTGALTEIRSNNVFVLAISDQGVASYLYTARVRYADN